MWQELLTGTVVSVVGEVLIVLAFLHMLSVRRSPGSMIAWTLAIFLLPWVAVPLYFLFGHRKLVKRYQKLQFTLHPAGVEKPLCDHPIERLLFANAIPPATSDNAFALYDTPQSAYDAMRYHIATARQSIDICTYELILDATIRPLLEALAQRAREGVRVRLLLDSIGAARLYFFPSRLRFLEEAGVQIAWFMPFLHLPTRNFVNLRNHRKLYLFDEGVVLTGGMNLSGEYMGPDASYCTYDDILCRIEGSAASFHRQIFEADWAFATGRKNAETPPAREGEGQACLQVAPSGPDTPSDGVVEALLSAICTARRRILIVTPYFVPNEEFMRAFAIALHRGVEVTVVVPERSDHLVSDLGRGSYLRELHARGARVLLYRGRVLHAKAMLFDDLAVVGTVNFDNRSLFYNFEVVNFLYSEPEVATVEAWSAKLLGHCVAYRPAEHPFQTRVENFMRMVAPLV
ncbi:phospholipase D-like domain-containing protein [Hydrogenimonas sp.]